MPTRPCANLPPSVNALALFANFLLTPKTRVTNLKHVGECGVVLGGRSLFALWSLTPGDFCTVRIPSSDGQQLERLARESLVNPFFEFFSAASRAARLFRTRSPRDELKSVGVATVEHQFALNAFLKRRARLEVRRKRFRRVVDERRSRRARCIQPRARRGRVSSPQILHIARHHRALSRAPLARLRKNYIKRRRER